MQVNPLFLFICKVILFLPLCYLSWYYLAEQGTFLTVLFTKPLLQTLFPALIADIQQSGHLIEVVANVIVPMQNVPQGMSAELPVLVNPLKYSYTLPLTLALILASPIKPAKTLSCIIISILIFTLIQVWGVSFESLKTLYFQAPPDVLLGHRPSILEVNIVALGYQLGYLMFPSVTPIIIWALFYQEYILQLTSIIRKKRKK